VYFTRGGLSNWTVLGLKILAHVNFFFSRVFARLVMRHTRVFSVEIPNYAYWIFFEDASFALSQEA